MIARPNRNENQIKERRPANDLSRIRAFSRIIDIADAREATACIGVRGRSICQFLGVCPAIWYMDAALVAFILFEI